MQSNHRDRWLLMFDEALATCLWHNDGFFEIDLLLKQIFDLFDILDVVLVQMQFFHRRVACWASSSASLLIDLSLELFLVVQTSLSSLLIQSLLIIPMLTIHLQILLILGRIETLLNNRLFPLLLHLTHQIILQSL